jgi:hypothetical protein
MKYDDDELAEAALLLAHAREEQEMPRGLERKLLAQGRAVASEVRFTTTKAAAVVVEEASDPLLRPRSIVRTWGGWFAAAACVAFLVFQWRTRAIEHETAKLTASVASTSSVIDLKDHAGTVVGVVRWDSAAGLVRLTLAGLPSSASGEHYRLWLSSSDAAHASAAGAFSCADGCEGRVLDAAGRADVPRAAWLTRNAVGEVTALPEASRTIAEGVSAVP